MDNLADLDGECDISLHVQDPSVLFSLTRKRPLFLSALSLLHDFMGNALGAEEFLATDEGRNANEAYDEDKNISNMI